jgi:hypothetical protein
MHFIHRRPGSIKPPLHLLNPAHSVVLSHNQAFMFPSAKI